jgi:hypothetical protein
VVAAAAAAAVAVAVDVVTTPLSWALEKLKFAQMFKKFPSFKETWKFIIVCIKAHNWSFLRQKNSVHFLTPYILRLMLIIIFPSTTVFPKWAFSFNFSD